MFYLFLEVLKGNLFTPSYIFRRIITHINIFCTLCLMYQVAVKCFKHFHLILVSLLSGYPTTTYFVKYKEHI